MNALTPKRGKKAPPKSKPGKYIKPELQASHTKRGPGRKAHGSANKDAPRTMVAPPPEKKLSANVGRAPRRIWREGEPVHIVKPVRVAAKERVHFGAGA